MVTIYAQNYVTRNGMIRFYSEAPLENIEAINRQVSSALNVESGEFVFRVVMRSFNFEKALMQEHFNENYVESHKYPNATFEGSIVNLNKIDLTKPGEYNAIVEGDLTIKDVTKSIKQNGTFLVKADEISGKSVFAIKLEDYNIKIPAAVKDNIAKEIEITVDVPLKKM